MAFSTLNKKQVRHDGSINTGTVGDARAGIRHIVGGYDENQGIYHPGVLILDSINSSGVTAQHALWVNDTNDCLKFSSDISALPATNAAFNTETLYPLKVDGLTAGTLSSANDTSGIAISSTNSKALGIHADTGGVALTAGNYRAGLLRFLVGTAITTGDISTYGAECLLKTIVNVTVTGNRAGVLGHYESAGTLTLTGGINSVNAGVASFLDIAAGGTVAANTVVSAFGVNPANFGTMTGRSTIIHVTNPMASTWGSFLELSSATGVTQDSAAGATGDKFLKVYVNTVLYTIAMLRA